MSPDSGEDVLVVGPRGPARSTGPLTWFGLAAVGAAAVLLIDRGTASHHADGAFATVGPTSSASAPPIPVPAGRPVVVNDEYLIEVPAGDMRDALASVACRGRCTAYNLAGRALARRAAAFEGLRPLAGGFVLARNGSAVQQSIEGRAAPDALAHLVIQRATGAATGAVQVSEQRAYGSRTVHVSVVREGWLFSATLVVRGTAPPIAAARAWATGAPAPG